MAQTSGKEHEAVTNFRNYLRIPTMHPNVNYSECVQFLLDQGKSLGLPTRVFRILPDKPVVIITWIGKEPDLPSILLNSHMDVVPVYPEHWTHDPFAAVKDEHGNIFARGSQDMKCVGIQYLETIRRYIREKLSFRRTIHISFVPEEEVGGINGMREFVETDDFRSLNVGFALDEGLANPTEEFVLYYGERTIWHLDVVCPGTTGHGSALHENTAGEKVRYIVDKFMDFRQKEKERLKADPNLFIGDVTTVNLTMLSGGVQVNVVPTELTATFDVRVAVDVDHDQLLATMKKWCEEAGKGTHIRFTAYHKKGKLTELDDTNIWWKSFKRSCDEMNLKVKQLIFPGGTDSRFIRNKGIPAIGFSPMNNTPILLHDNNEFLNEAVFLKGIDIYYNIIQNLASC